MRFKKSDGGRKDAGYRGRGGDCVTRAIAIATGTPYLCVRKALTEMVREGTGGIERGVANGCPTPVAHTYLTAMGWEAVPTPEAFYLNELPRCGKFIACMTTRRHWAAVINDTLVDSWDCRKTPRTNTGWMKLEGYYKWRER